MATTEGSEPVTVLGPIYLEDEAIEKRKFLDAAALAALPWALAYWENYMRKSDGLEFEEIPVCAAQDAYAVADGLLAERDRRRGEKKE
jgi:hypothetical protein